MAHNNELARILKDELEFPGKNGPLGAYLSVLDRFTTLDIMKAIPFLSKKARNVLNAGDFWKERWMSDFADQVSDIGPEIPEWIVNVEHPRVQILDRTLDNLTRILGGSNLSFAKKRDLIEQEARLTEERNAYLETPYVAWKKYWLWTYFFRRTLTRAVANLITQKLVRSNQDAGQIGTYYVTVVPGRDSLVSIQGGMDDNVVVYDVWSLVPLFDHWSESWVDEAFDRYLPKGPAPTGMRPNDFGLPFACALIVMKISPPDVNDMFRLGLLNQVFPFRQSRFAMAMTNLNLQASAQDRDELTQKYLDWYLYTTLERIYTNDDDDDDDDESFENHPKVQLARRVGGDAIIAIFKNFFEDPIQGRLTRGLWILLNEPRVGINPRVVDDPSPDEQSNKIFLGAACVTTTCAACGTKASHRCKRCKSALYCGKECQTSHWSAEHKNVCVPSLLETSKTQTQIGYNFEDERPTIMVNNWDYAFAAERYLSSKGKKGGIELATQRLEEAEAAGDRALIVYWWWVRKLLKEAFEEPWPIPSYTKRHPTTARYLTYKEWARQAYRDTKERDGDTPKTLQVRVREAVANTRRLANDLTSKSDPDRGFYWWVERELESYL